jgi:phospholipase/carboxylesterase
MTTSLDAVTCGAPIVRAKAAMILMHGRGAGAESMLSLAEALAEPDMACIAPQAPDNSWYPYSFLAPIPRNEPHLSRSLATIGQLVECLSAHGLGAKRLVLFGFSQGGCLALEFAARNARRYGAIVGLSAGIVGPDSTSRTYTGSLAGTPVFLGCSDVDAHIPLSRVQETSRCLRALGGEVIERIYPGMGHAINDDEIRRVRALLAGALCMSAGSRHE